MNVIRSNEYEQIRTDFFNKHHNDFKLKTTGDTAEYYNKTYAFEDGAVWYEVMTKQFIEETVQVKLVPVTIVISMMQTEFWSTDESISRFYFEQWNYHNPWKLE